MFYLSLINESPFIVNHLLREFNTVTGFIRRSCIFLLKISMLVSSAYSIGLEAEFFPSGISLIYRGNNNGPKIEPWRMPHLFPNFLFSLFQTRCKKRIVLLQIPYYVNLSRRISWFTQSNALAKWCLLSVYIF